MLYKFYRNAVNRERKSCKASFYKSNVEHMKEENPKVWWKEVKRLCGFNSNPGNVSSQIHIEGIENLSDQDLANAINEAFLEPLEEYRLPQPLTKLRIDEDSPELPEVLEMRIFKLLAALNPSKACGPDKIPNWMLKEYAERLSFPISRIINLSLKEQSLPKIWKFADVSPLPKVKPVEDLKKQLRPISLTPYSEGRRRVRGSRLRTTCSSRCARPKPIWCCSQFLNYSGTDTHASQLVQGN